ncbi:hypothetical protein QJU93_09950 [Pasteurella skyensis]|uniref:Uncharacterized protein n=1 Tax=Phocoenobacter skyensis TaxID=97481 RepID=A0AAJ6NBB8_9PAST|nr:hypothetical protein [Pasteurella skyensis]MDP8173677.1 hypothetical protein [Pasteurella skyensis]MDP8178045.1 hypothetical protein [Pasteurella skyensis]
MAELSYYIALICAGLATLKFFTSFWDLEKFIIFLMLLAIALKIGVFA